MATRTMTDFIKSLGTVTTPLGLSILLANSIGEPKRGVGFSLIPFFLGYCIDADAETETSIKKTSSSTLNLPTTGNGGWIITFAWDTSARIQIFIPFVNGYIYQRVRMTDYWRGWTLFQGNIIT